VKAISDNSIVGSWISACEHLSQQGTDWREYNLILEIANPTSLSNVEHTVVNHLNAFYRARDAFSVNTVVNTIFPAQLYVRYGSSGVYEKYMQETFPQLRKHPDYRWGTYAQRMLHRLSPKGAIICPLRDLVEKLKTQLTLSGPNRAIYEIGLVDLFSEMPIYDPAMDRTRPISGPCLSHISFKLGPNRDLRMTAFYRSHYYIERALGNLMGLAHLQNFVARETGLTMGSLTCISSLAQLETSKKWRKSDVKSLISECARIYSGSAVAA
jgi:hypothetical protein